MREMSHKEKIKYSKLVSDAKQLRFDMAILNAADSSEGPALFVCRDGFMQYYFSRYPEDEEDFQPNAETDVLNPEKSTSAETDERSASYLDDSVFDSGMYQYGFDFFKSKEENL